MEVLDLSKRYGLNIVIGADWLVHLTVEDDGSPVDFSGATFLCQVRKTVGGAIIATPSVSGDQNGNITLSLSKEITSAIEIPAKMPYDSARPYYDIFVTMNGMTERLIEGSVEISPAISEEE